MKATQARRLCVALFRSRRMKRGKNSPRIFEGSPLSERLIDFVSVIFWRARHREANGVHGLADSFAFPVNPTQNSETEYCSFMEQTWKGEKTIGIREEIKSYIIRSDMTEVVDRLYDNYNWSHIVPNLSGKLRRGSLRYQEAVEFSDVLDYDIVWVKRKR